MLGESWVSSVELHDAIVWWVDSGVNYGLSRGHLVYLSVSVTPSLIA